MLTNENQDVGVPEITGAYIMEFACYFYSCVLIYGCGYVHTTVHVVGVTR